MTTSVLSEQECQQILKTLKARFVKMKHRHERIDWANVELKLKAMPEKLWTLYQMEETGGEPDVIAYESENDVFVFCDCSAESPKGRRSLCFDKAAWEERKEHKPVDNVLDMAAEMGIELLSEVQYRQLQTLDAFDLKTSSWLKTPDSIRNLGGALFCDRRFDTVFVYHNGAMSYYAARGFRGLLKV